MVSTSKWEREKARFSGWRGWLRSMLTLEATSQLAKRSHRTVLQRNSVFSVECRVLNWLIGVDLHTTIYFQ